MAGNNAQTFASYAQRYQAYAGRNQGPELIFSAAFAAGSRFTLPNPINLSRPLEALLVTWRGRIEIGVANIAVLAAESPQTIINNFQVFGTYKGTSQTPWNISGATAFAMAQCFGARGNSLIINGVRQPALGVPLAQAGATFGNIGTFDVEIQYLLPTWPFMANANRAHNSRQFYWQSQDWNNTLQLQMTFGDSTSFGTPGAGTTTTFSAFGSAAGSPTVTIAARYVILGSVKDGFKSSLVTRNESTVTSLVTAASAQQIALLQRQKTTNVIVKSGSILAGTSAFANVFTSLSDVQLDRTQILVDNKAIRNNQSNPQAKEHAGIQYSTVVPGGYLPFSFIDAQNPWTAFRGDDANVVPPGASFQLMTDILTANAANGINFIQEQIIAEPNDPRWMGTR